MRNYSVSFVVLLASLLLGAAACGDDTGVSGVSAESGDTVSGTDGTIAGADGALTDGTVGVDGVTSIVCGDGKCDGPSETSANCPADCGGNTLGDATTTGPAVCGDGKCQAPGETMFLCPADCKTPATDAEACKHKACQPQYDACSGDPACMAQVACENSGGQNCAKDKKADQELNALSGCIQQANCTNVGLKQCGDGTCQSTETMLTCPQDCKTPVDPQETCIQKGCPDDYKACQADAACVKIVDCVNNNQNNPNQCFQNGGQPSDVIQGFFQCAQQSGCFGGGGGGGGGGGTGATCGNGQCNQGETMLTCPADCKQPKTPTEACYHKACPNEYSKCSADADCVKTVDCFNTGGDANQCGSNVNQQALNVCIQKSGCDNGGGGGGGGGLQNCGDGKCADGETNLTCPDDCPTATDPQEICLQKNCSKQYTQCQNSDNCTTAIDCYNQGGDPQQCFGNGGKSLQGLLQCGFQSGCITQGGGGGGGGGNPPGSCKGKCGVYDKQASCQCDNACLQNNNCCADMQTLCGGGGPTVVCGDNVCDSSESSATCPKDCPAGPTPCKTKGDCSSTEVCCAAAGGSVCVAVGQCK